MTPAIGKNLSKRCLAKKCSGSYCLEPLDAPGQRAQICLVEDATIHRHDTVRDGLQPELKRYVTSLKTEQFIHELAQFNEDTGKSTEPRMDIIAEMPNRRAMFHSLVFLSTAKQWNSTRWNEMQKHMRYVAHVDGRGCANVKFYAAVVNTYGKVGQEFEDFACRS